MDDTELWIVIELSKDDTGHVDFDDVEMWALSTGHHNSRDMAILESLMDAENERADELDEWRSASYLSDELDYIDPTDFDSREDYLNALCEEAEDHGFDIDFSTDGLGSEVYDDIDDADNDFDGDYDDGFGSEW